MSKELHPFFKLNDLIEEFNSTRENINLERLQSLREDIAINLFLLSDSVSQTIANAESKDYDRKRFYAEKEEFYRNSIDERTGKNHNVADSERLARLDAKEIDEACSFAYKQKERARLVVIAVQQILNSISGRISNYSK